MADSHIHIIGARQNNLKNVDVRIPLNALTVITGRVGVGQVEPRLRRALRRGAAPLRRELLGLYAPVPRPHGQAAGRAHRRHPAGDRDRPGQLGEDVALDGRHDDRAARSSEAALRQDRRAALPPVRPAGAARDGRVGRATRAARARPRARACWSPSPSRCRRICRGSEARAGLSPPASAACWSAGEVRRDRGAWRRRRRALVVVADRLVVRADQKRRICRFARAGVPLRQGTAALLSSPTTALHRAAYSELARVRALPHHLPRADREPVLLQQPARRLRELAAASGARSTSTSTWSFPIRRRRSPTAHQAVEHAVDGVGARRAGALLQARRRLPMDVPFEQLDARRSGAAIIDGEGKFYGIRGWFRWLEGRTYKMHVRVFLARYRSYRICPACNGGRLKPEASLFRIDGTQRRRRQPDERRATRRRSSTACSSRRPQEEIAHAHPRPRCAAACATCSRSGSTT